MFVGLVRLCLSIIDLDKDPTMLKNEKDQPKVRNFLSTVNETRTHAFKDRTATISLQSNDVDLGQLY